MSGARHRHKGDRIERELVERHKAIGVHAERYPLSGASRFRDSGHDIDIYALGREEAPLVAESKARKNGAGFVQLEKWLGEYDALFLRRNNTDPMVLLPWRVWAQLLERGAAMKPRLYLRFEERVRCACSIRRFLAFDIELTGHGLRVICRRCHYPLLVIELSDA